MQETLKRNPYDGHLRVFRGRRGDLIKVIWHDGQKMRPFPKRLDCRRFLWPPMVDGTVTNSSTQLGYFSTRRRRPVGRGGIDGAV